jgi:hypothetical protein
MCYELEEYLHQRAEEARRAAEERARKEKAPEKPADRPREQQPDPVPV